LTENTVDIYIQTSFFSMVPAKIIPLLVNTLKGVCNRGVPTPAKIHGVFRTSLDRLRQPARVCRFQVTSAESRFDCLACVLLSSDVFCPVVLVGHHYVAHFAQQLAADRLDRSGCPVAAFWAPEHASWVTAARVRREPIAGWSRGSAGRLQTRPECL